MAKILQGARVEFTRAHDTQTKLTGTVETIAGEDVLVKTDPDGVAVFAVADACTVLEDAPASDAPDAPPAPPADKI